MLSDFMHIPLFTVHPPTKVRFGNHGNWICLVRTPSRWLSVTFNRFSTGWELSTQQLSVFVKTSAHLAWRLQCAAYSLCCWGGETMQRHQWKERLYDSCHFESRQRIPSESRCDIVLWCVTMLDLMCSPLQRETVGLGWCYRLRCLQSDLIKSTQGRT